MTLDSYKSKLHRTAMEIATDSRRTPLAKSVAYLALELASNAARKHVSRERLPLGLICLFAIVIGLNAAACILMMCFKRFQSGLLQVLVNCVFGFLIAVEFPMLVLVYCLTTFESDRERFTINEAVFPPGRYERLGRAIANPVVIANVLNSLDSLRIQSVATFFTRVGTDLSLCLQFAMLATNRHQLRQKQSSLYPHRHPVALVFVLILLGVAVYISQSIRSSEAACAPHLECVVHAFRWIRLHEGDMTQCSCLTLIDENLIPKIYAEWQHPKNVTEKLAQLASSGDLQAIQFTSRLLPTLPEELRRCVNLKHLALIYTHTEALPPWFKEFTKLEFVHIEGALDIASLVSLPDDLFENMDSLTFLQLGAHSNLRRLPSFQGLVNLRSLSLAVLLELQELPAFTNLTKLEQLGLPLLPRIDSFPGMTPIHSLIGFVLSYSGGLCCNGFLDNQYDLIKRACYLDPAWEIPPPTCLSSNRTDKFVTEATRSTFAKFSATVCFELAPPIPRMSQYPLEAEVRACNGTLYRKCAKADNRTDMCYSLRMMPITCADDPFPMAMRKRQILENVGDPCDPVEEAWLGCPSP